MNNEDTRRLIAISIKKLENNLWSIDIDGGESYKVEGSLDEIKRALRRSKAKDGAEYGKCRSSKVGTYASMSGDIDNNDLHKINVWKSKVPHSPDDFKKLMENKEMKTITLTKNYLIEGNIVLKGTVVELKEEKIDFLPTDIWNKVQEIKDETERFEYVKKELGDEFTDEEIKDFLNKYENNLNESLKESNGFYYICYYGSSGDGYVGYDNRPTNNLDDAIQFDDKKEAELFKKDLQKEWKSKLYIAYYSE